MERIFKQSTPWNEKQKCGKSEMSKFKIDPTAISESNLHNRNETKKQILMHKIARDGNSSECKEQIPCRRFSAREYILFVYVIFM